MRDQSLVKIIHVRQGELEHEQLVVPKRFELDARENHAGMLEWAVLRRDFVVTVGETGYYTYILDDFAKQECLAFALVGGVDVDFGF